jgi:hypothetical protein
MSRALIRAIGGKELRQLLPAIVALGALWLWGVIDSFVLKPPDVVTWGSETWLLARDTGWHAIAELAIGFVIAYSLLPGEHAQRTIDFLYSLPVRRRTIFFSKYLVGVALQMAVDLLGTATSLAHYAVTANSLDHRAFRASTAALQLGADVLTPFICIAYGVLMSYFRRLGWILAALVWLALELAERVRPALRIFNVKSLMMVEHDGAVPLVDWRAWALHLGMAALCLAVAERLWLGRQERFTAFYDRIRASVALRRAATLAAVGLVALVIAGAMIGDGGKPKAGDDDDKPSAARVLSFDTEHFHFTYRDAEAGRALVIIKAADQAYADVRGWLGAPAGDRVVADLTDESAEHLGIAGWTKMRLDLSRPDESGALLRHVLYHETTHVVAAALSEGMSDARAMETRFFAEGLAEYVAFELLPDLEAERARAREVAALAHERYRLRFQDLLAPKAFVARYDESLLYPLGEIFTAALVETCGRQSPRELLRAFASPDTPRSLEGVELWRATLQTMRCDLDRVLGRYEGRLRKLAPAAAEAIPVATATLSRREGDALLFDVTVAARAPGPWPVSLRARADADAPPGDVVIREALVPTGGTKSIRVPLPDGVVRRLEFQVGARAAARAALYSRWESTAVP